MNFQVFLENQVITEEVFAIQVFAMQVIVVVKKSNPLDYMIGLLHL